MPVRADQPRGDQFFGASSKPSNWKPGDTVQPHKVQSPSVSAACQARAGDCASLRRQVRTQLADPSQPGGNRLRLQQALAVP